MSDHGKKKDKCFSARVRLISMLLGCRAVEYVPKGETTNRSLRWKNFNQDHLKPPSDSKYLCRRERRYLQKKGGEQPLSIDPHHNTLCGEEGSKEIGWGETKNEGGIVSSPVPSTSFTEIGENEKHGAQQENHPPQNYPQGQKKKDDFSKWSRNRSQTVPQPILLGVHTSQVERKPPDSYKKLTSSNSRSLSGSS